MSNTPSDEPLPEPYFHDESGALRLWVRTQGGQDVGAILRKEVLHFRFRAAASGADALTIYLAHRDEIDAAVLRRIAAGSIEPVLLREGDFDARPRGEAPPG